MTEKENENNSIIQWSGNFGLVDPESKFWNDLEEFGEKQLLNMKIIKIKVYTRLYSEKNIIVGINITYKKI